MVTKYVKSKQPNSRMCFVCGLENDFGLKARFYSVADKELVGLFIPSEEHQGYPGRLHGGIASTILDETIGRAFLIEHQDSWWVTAELSVRFRKPIPLAETIRVVGRITGRRGRIFEGTGEILLPDGTPAAMAKGKYFAQPIDEITGSEDFADEMWSTIVEPQDPETVELP